MAASNIELTWLGHSTFLIRTPEGKTILIDPWMIGNPRCPKEFHRVDSDAILLTHGHFDHIGDAVASAKRCSGPVVGIFELASWLKGQGVEESKVVGINKGGTATLSSVDVKVTMTDARHSSALIEDGGRPVYLGEPAGFVITFSDDTRLYVAGDTCLFGDMEWIRTLYRPVAAILPIGDFYTMDPRAAAHACRLLGVRSAIPCHYGTFPALIGTPEQLKAELKALELDVSVIAPEPGRSTPIV